MDKVFPKLYEQSSTGKVKHWTISVLKRGIFSTIRVEYGAGDSKVRVTDKDISVGKNLGKSNETTPHEQALSEAQATWKKKLDKGYVENLRNLQDEVLLPMLAHSFQKRGHNIAYPCYVQPKLDGVRCLAKKIDESTIKYYSRMGKEFDTLEHLTPRLLDLLKINEVLDGEVYSHDHTFQEMIRLVKKLRPESIILEYHVFDYVNVNIPFKGRYALLEDMFEKASGQVSLLPCEKLESVDDVSAKHSEYVKAGYEGLILRNLTGMYKLKGRSADLQKYKEFQDEEYEIIGGQESTGPEAGCVIFTVITNKNQEFAVRPRGSFELRKLWMKDIQSIIGKKLTVRYQELTDDGIPRFPVGISIRDYE